jgi:hypothetical protein
VSYNSIVLAESGLVSFYELDESTGTSAADSKGTNTGTYTGGFTLGQTGVSGQSVLFNGTSGYVTVPTSASLEITTNITLELWFKLTGAATTATWNKMLEKGYSADVSPFVNYTLGANTGTTAASAGHFVGTGGKTLDFCLTLGGVFNECFSNTIPLTNVWYYVVGTYDGSVMKIYVNGTLENSLTVSGSITNSAQPLMIGAHNRGGSIAEYFPGTIDTVAVYNVALSSTAVSNHYAAGIDAARTKVTYALPKSSPLVAKSSYKLVSGAKSFVWPNLKNPTISGSSNSAWIPAKSPWGTVRSTSDFAPPLNVEGAGFTTAPDDITLFFIGNVQLNSVFNMSSERPICTASNLTGYAIEYVNSATTFAPYLNMFGVANISFGINIPRGHWVAVVLTRSRVSTNAALYAWDYDTKIYYTGTATSSSSAASGNGVAAVADQGTGGRGYVGSLALAGFVGRTWTEKEARRFFADPFQLVRPYNATSLFYSSAILIRSRRQSGPKIGQRQFN